MRIPAHVVYRGFGTETVVLNLSTGTYHGLNPTGGRMLEVLADAPSVEAAAQTLAAEYGMPAETVLRDVRELCDGLVERGLLEPAPHLVIS